MQFKTMLIFFHIFTDLGDLSSIVIRFWLLAKRVYSLLVDFDVSKGCCPLLARSRSDKVEVYLMRGTQEDNSLNLIRLKRQIPVGPGLGWTTVSIASMGSDKSLELTTVICDGALCLLQKSCQLRVQCVGIIVVPRACVRRDSNQSLHNTNFNINYK